MRFLVFLSVLTAGLSGISGYFLWQTHGQRSYENSAAARVRLKIEFQSKNRPEFLIPLEEFRQNRETPELVNPRSTLPHTAEFPFAEMAAVSRYAKTCKDPLGSANRTSQLSTPALKKALLWHEFLCGKVAKLPVGFFDLSVRDQGTAPPFGLAIHPSGSSYVQLALLSGRREFLDPQWIAAHSSGLHLLEYLRRVHASQPLSLSAWELQEMLNGEDLVVTPSHVLFSVSEAGPEKPTAKYAAFNRTEWDQFLAKKSFLVSIRKLALLLFLGSLTLTLGLIATLIKRFQTQKKETAQRLFALQMLTHELRTPAAAIRLALEAQRREFDLLPIDSQQAFLQICEELGRLDRVVEASRLYLKNDHSHDHLETGSAGFHSANELIAQAVEPYLDRITYRPLQTDRLLRFTSQFRRYWIELCVKNLVENALTHGRSPVVVSLSADSPSSHSGDFLVSVEDQGSVSFASLDEIIALRKTSATSGLGLGLTIVKKVVGTMNGELTFKSSPTRFTIRLPNTGGPK